MARMGRAAPEQGDVRNESYFGVGRKGGWYAEEAVGVSRPLFRPPGDEPQYPVLAATLRAPQAIAGRALGKAASFWCGRWRCAVVGDFWRRRDLVGAGGRSAEPWVHDGDCDDGATRQSGHSAAHRRWRGGLHVSPRSRRREKTKVTRTGHRWGAGFRRPLYSVRIGPE